MTSPRSSASSTPASSSTSPSRTLGKFSLKSALKKPFQGWSRELLPARDNDDDDYNFTSGSRRECEPNSHRNDR
ncbi:hypothetical protein CC86DRAFT_204545 [Ophiobolus disseminans]|uniref:Uncharacterized protein n=1 Tax=Ophiobolus disseminans TaxID=1469910 RepID=A0A6A7A5L1_9PLEO|nr:hypothetical protein CC86DRAFT_204545 [Ophiobolus disseminans]